MRLILASSSSYRKTLLERLHIPFGTCSPAVDESPLLDETPVEMVMRLSEAKARNVAEEYPDALVIGSDQVSVNDGEILGKPGNAEQAEEQLSRASGQRIDFQTGLCLYNAIDDSIQVDHVRYSVYFRELSRAQIRAYIDAEKPFDCAGSFKSEGLGIALFRKMEGSDPAALIGLPLIRLISMLEQEGIRFGQGGVSPGWG